jgi:hypothetical protein
MGDDAFRYVHTCRRSCRWASNTPKHIVVVLGGDATSFVMEDEEDQARPYFLTG